MEKMRDREKRATHFIEMLLALFDVSFVTRLFRQLKSMDILSIHEIKGNDFIP